MRMKRARVSLIFTLGLLGYLLNLVFLQIEHYVLRWRISGEAA